MGEDLIDKIFALEDVKNYFFQNIPLILMVLDKEGKIADVNNTFCKALDYSKKEVLGKSYTEFLHPDDVEKSIKIEKENVYNETFLKGGKYFSNRYRRRNGSYVKFCWREDGALYYNGHYIAYAEISEDAKRR
jgi:PAS domain S-box-containing protein